ncbi:MAG: leucine-rich repeat protein, partial [Thermoguttaceae bacterium]|nr:leucine-rich repeat protein [Thermoguttaceae bacterium]
TAFLCLKDGGSYKIVGVRDRDATKLVIPSKIDGVFVRKIGEGAFKGLKRLETVSWPSAAGPCEMEPGAFEFCSALKKVELPENLQAIPDRAFCGCVALETVFGGGNVRTIGERAFAGCKSLENVSFKEATSIGFWAFAGCERLPKFDMVSQKGGVFQEAEGLLLSKDGETLYACPPGRTGEVVVPEGVRLIAKGAFQGGKIETVVLPQSLEIVDAEAFAFCSKLKSVLGAPDALEIVGDSAFSNCSSLERFDWPKNLQVIGKSAFSHCALTSAEIESVRRIGEYAFQYCGKLTTLSAPSETREIEAGAFFGTKLTTFKIPRDLETLQAGALDCFSLENIEIEEGNKAFKIVDGALLSADGKTLYRVDASAKGPTWKIPDGVRVVARSAFRGNKTFVSLEIPEGVETIGKGAFYACSALEKLKIPASLRELDDRFSLCSPNLTFEVAEGNPTYKSVDGSLLSADGKTLYRVGGNWEKKVLVLPEGVERLAPGSCAGKQTFVKIPSTVKRIDSGAFSDCDEMTGIVIPASVERLDERFISSKITTFEVAPENPNYKSV